jgi:hypothetical protein
MRSDTLAMWSYPCLVPDAVNRCGSAGENDYTTRSEGRRWRLHVDQRRYMPAVEILQRRSSRCSPVGKTSCFARRRSASPRRRCAEISRHARAEMRFAPDRSR